MKAFGCFIFVVVVFASVVCLTLPQRNGGHMEVI